MKHFVNVPLLFVSLLYLCFIRFMIIRGCQPISLSCRVSNFLHLCCYIFCFNNFCVHFMRASNTDVVVQRYRHNTLLLCCIAQSIQL